MGKCVFLAVFIIGAFLMQFGNGQVVTSEVLDRINVDTYLQNRRLVEYHISCLVYGGPCDKIGNEMKRLFNTFRYSGVNSSECRVCSEDQKMKLAKIARHWQMHYPQAWRELSAIIGSR